MTPGIDLALQIALLMTLGVLCQWMAWRMRLPAILPLLLGEALMANGINVKVVDDRREGLQEARMLGMKTFYGSPLSEHADRFLDLIGFTHLFALSRNPEANAMVCARYRHDFGPVNVYAIQPSGADESDTRQAFVRGLRASVLFGKDASWAKLASLIGQGATVHSTTLSDEYDFEAFVASQDKQAVNLFALDGDGNLQVFSSHHELEPVPGWIIVSLVNQTSSD